MAEKKKEFSFQIAPKFKVLDVQSFDDVEVSEASVKSMLPEGFNAKMNIDLMPVVFNLAVVNEVNQNDDAMNTMAAIKCVKNFANKPINIEHKKHKIVGHMINASLSEKEFDFGDNDIESYADKTEPFYLNAFGFIYRKIFPDLAESIIESASEDSEDYQNISTSWELASRQFKIIKGNSKKVCECEFVEQDDYEEYRAYLKRFGGSGKDKNGDSVARVFCGDVIPLCAGLTMKPAARVKGIYPVDPNKEESKDEKAVANKQKNSQLEKKDVTTNKSNILNMDEKQFQEFVKQTTEAIASVVKGDDQAKSIGILMQETLEKHGESWKSKVDLESEARENTEKELKSLQDQHLEVSNELDKLKTEIEAKASAELFNDRMNHFDDKYDLSEEESKIIASKLKAVKEDEAFEVLKNEIEVIFAHKDKETMAQAKKDQDALIEQAIAEKLEKSDAKTDETEVKASTEEETETEIETEEIEAESSLPNGNGEGTQEETLYEKAKAGFAYKIS